MRTLLFVTMIAFGIIQMSSRSRAAALDEYRWKNRVLVVIAPKGDAAAEAQRKILNSSAKGMSERFIVLIEAIGEGETSRHIRSRFSADGKDFQVFPMGKDGNTAMSSDKPLSAEYLFGKVDAMPMRRDEMTRPAM
jgi:hypothetical protein